MTPSFEELLAAAPPPREVAGAPARVATARREQGRRALALDDDPTGSQAVHDVEVVTALERDELARALAAPGATAFALTNSRSLPEDEAAALTRRVAAEALRAVADAGGDPALLDLVSRSDSTLRGHVGAEVEAVQAAREEVVGGRADAVLLAPAYLEAGRATAGGVHWARTGGAWVPVGETEFARDATFGYAASDLRDWLAERTGGRVHPEDVAVVGLADLRGGGPDRVAELLAGVRGGRFAVLDAVTDADLDTAALGVLAAQGAGSSFVHRCGPSWVRALAGVEPRPPLGADEVGPRDGGHGLVVVGSHVGLTSRQVERALAAGGLEVVDLDVEAVTDEDTGRRDAEVARAAGRVRDLLAGSDVLLLTSRQLRRGADGAASLELARRTSAAVVDVVRGALPARPGWVVAKGGITSHDVAVRALGIRRARVVGQLLPGQVSLLQPLEAAEEAVGVPYVVFAGNVGDEGSLARVVEVLRG